MIPAKGNEMLEINVLAAIVKAIVDHQQMVIGPLALEQARRVDHLRISNGDNVKVEVIDGDPNLVLTELVRNYAELFGQASVEVCKDAVKELKPRISPDELPAILR